MCVKYALNDGLNKEKEFVIGLTKDALVVVRVPDAAE